MTLTVNGFNCIADELCFKSQNYICSLTYKQQRFTICVKNNKELNKMVAEQIFNIREQQKQGDYYYITRINKKDVVIARIMRDLTINSVTPKHKYDTLQSELENVCRKWRITYKIKLSDNAKLLSDHQKEYLKRYLEQRQTEINDLMLMMYKQSKQSIIEQLETDIALIIDTYEREVKEK